MFLSWVACQGAGVEPSWSWSEARDERIARRLEDYGGGVWKEALRNYTEVARAERKKGDAGKYIVAFAENFCP